MVDPDAADLVLAPGRDSRTRVSSSIGLPADHGRRRSAFRDHPGADFRADPLHHPSDWTDRLDCAVDTAVGCQLAADAVQKVGNGHPGTAMSLATAYTLFQRVMRHDPGRPALARRDRFVLSCGHSSLTLYLQLYLGGFGLELSDIESLRTWGSKTPAPGVPHHGVEITTGPLGQGLAVGGRHGDGVAPSAVCSIRTPHPAPARSTTTSTSSPPTATSGGHQRGLRWPAPSSSAIHRLGTNEISIEHNTRIAFTEDVRPLPGLTAGTMRPAGSRAGRTSPTRGRHRQAQAVTDKPHSSRIRTIIGYPAPTKMNTGGSTAPRSAPRRWPRPRRSSGSTRQDLRGRRTR